MKCKPKDCPGCVHFINLKTHPLFKEFVIKSEDGKIIDFEGCIFHLSVMFQRQSWVRQIGIQVAVEGVGSRYGDQLGILNETLARGGMILLQAAREAEVKAKLLKQGS